MILTFYADIRIVKAPKDKTVEALQREIEHLRHSLAVSNTQCDLMGQRNKQLQDDNKAIKGELSCLDHSFFEEIEGELEKK